MGGCQGVPGGQEGIQGIPWGHRVGLMSLLMIHKAYMPVYSDPDFSCGRTGRTDGTGPTEGSTRGPRGPKKNKGRKSKLELKLELSNQSSFAVPYLQTIFPRFQLLQLRRTSVCTWRSAKMFIVT